MHSCGSLTTPAKPCSRWKTSFWKKIGTKKMLTGMTRIFKSSPGASSRPTNYAVDFDRTVYDDEETDDAYYAEDYIADRKSRKKQRKKGSGGLVLLLLGELAGIAGIIWWWIKWLS